MTDHVGGILTRDYHQPEIIALQRSGNDTANYPPTAQVAQQLVCLVRKVRAFLPIKAKGWFFQNTA